MRPRSFLAPVAAGLLVMAACGDDSSSTPVTREVSDPTSAASTSATTNATADDTTDDTTADADDPATPPASDEPGVAAPNDISALEPPSDPAMLLGDDPEEGLAALGFPEGWVLPNGGLDDVVGVEVSYEQGENVVYSHHTTTYRVAPTDPEQIAQEWSGLFSDAIGVDTERLGTITGDGYLTVSWSSPGDVEPDHPKLELDVITIADDSTAPVLVKVEFASADATLPSLALPLDIDPTLPGVDPCGTQQVRIDLLGYQDAFNPDRTPTYEVHWEGQCTGLDTFEAALQWFRDNGRDAPEGTTSMGGEFANEDGITIKVQTSKLDDGNTSYNLTFSQPIALD